VSEELAMISCVSIIYIFVYRVCSLLNKKCVSARSSLFAWAENKQLKVLLVDLLGKKNTDGWLKISS
jgi:hypothetical protein